MFDTLRPQLKNLDAWVAEWETDAEDQRTLYLNIADVASEAGEADESYNYLLRALRTIPAADSNTEESQQLSIRALKAALSHPSHFSFQDLTALDSIQALRNSHPTHFELLEVFNAELLDDYHDFLTTYPDFLSSENLREDVLERKMRLLHSNFYCGFKLYSIDTVRPDCFGAAGALERRRNVGHRCHPRRTS